MTWPDPELLAGDDELCRPLPDELLDLDELAELDDLPAAELADPPELVLRLLCSDVVACAEPGRL